MTDAHTPQSDGCTCWPCNENNAESNPARLRHCAACCFGSGISEYDVNCPIDEHRALANRQFGGGAVVPYNTNLTRKGEARRKLIQRQMLQSIVDKGLDTFSLTSDVLPPIRCSVGSFAHIYRHLDVAIKDALLNGNTSQPTSPEELADAIEADPVYWLAVVQGEHSVTTRGLVAVEALTARLSAWPLTYWQRAIVARWISAGNDDTDELAALLAALESDPNYNHYDESGPW